MDFTVGNNKNTLKATNTSDLIAELKRRHDFDEFVIENTDEQTIVHLMETRGIKPLYDARPVELVHELRRQMYRKCDFDKYYHNEKKELCQMLPMKWALTFSKKRRISCVEPGAPRRVNG